MAIFAYYAGKRWFAWDVDSLPQDIRETMGTTGFYDSTDPSATRLHFRSSTERKVRQDFVPVRAAFYRKSGETGEGESLTHLLFKIAFEHVSRVTILTPGLSNSGTPLQIEFLRVETEAPVHISHDRVLRIDVLASVSGPKRLLEYWGDQLAIEVFHTHKTDENKAQILYQRRIPCIEVEIPKDFVIADSAEPTEAEVENYLRLREAWIKANILHCEVLSRPIREEFLGAKIKDLDGKLTDVASQLKERDVQVAASNSKIQLQQSIVTTQKKEIDNLQSASRAALVENQNKNDRINKLLSRSLWARIWNSR